MIEGWSSDTTPTVMKTPRLLLPLILCACPASSTEPTGPSIADSDSSSTTSPDTTDSPMPTTTDPDSTGEPEDTGGTSGASSETGDPPADTTSSESGDSDTGEPPPPPPSPAVFLCCAGTNVQCSQGDQMCTQFGYCPYDCDTTVTDSCGDPAWATCQVVNGLPICVKTTPSDCIPSASGEETTTASDSETGHDSTETTSSETTSDESTTSTSDQPTGEG